MVTMDLKFPHANKLLPFQVEAINKTLCFLNSNPAHSCYNACEMGLGKTVQAIVAANTLGLTAESNAKILIICPAIMRLVWERELKSWAVSKTLTTLGLAEKIVTVLTSQDAVKLSSKSWAYCVISYDLAATDRILDKLSEIDWDLLIMDEAHYLKNGRAKRTKAVLQRLWPKARYKLALSGTPFTTRIVDGYTLFSRMIPGRWKDFFAFAGEFSYCRIKNIGHRVVHDYFGVKNPERLRSLIRSSFYIRYTKEEVLKDLPPKIFNRITLPISYAVVPRSKDAKTQLEIEAHLVRRAIENDVPIRIPESLAEHRRLQGEAKVPAIVDFVKDLLDQEIPVVLFGWHRNVIDALASQLSAYSPSVVTGETPSEVRIRNVERFQLGETSLFIGNIIASGVGITLTASSTVVLAELDWSPATVSQAIDRTHRIGQKNTVNIYYFVVENSIDESITNTILNRAKIFRSILNSTENAA